MTPCLGAWKFRLFLALCLFVDCRAGILAESSCDASVSRSFTGGHSMLQKRSHMDHVEVVDLHACANQPDIAGNASFDEAGYQSVAVLCCELQMDLYIRRVIKFLGLEVCNEYGLLGFVPWYMCHQGVAFTQGGSRWVHNYQTLVEEILRSTPPAQCPFVCYPGKCPTSFDDCNGVVQPNGYNRRRCQANSTSIVATTIEASTTIAASTTSAEAPTMTCQTERMPPSISSRTTCQLAMWWAKTIGIHSHPSWYPGMTGQSSWRAFQEHIASMSDPQGCVQPCPPSSSTTTVADQAASCHTEIEPPETLTTCQLAMWWAKAIGINSHPSWYPAGLTGQSSWRAFQKHIASLPDPQGCLQPCATEETTTESPR